MADRKPETGGPKINLHLRLAVTILVVATAFTAIFIWAFNANRESFMRFGLQMKIDDLQQKLLPENGLTTDQYQECVGYLNRLKRYVRDSPMNRDTYANYRRVITPFRQALLDSRISPGELIKIRNAVWFVDLSVRRPQAKINNPSGRE